jgi:ribosome-binding factor A
LSRRTERASKLIQREISILLEREVNDPRLAKLVSVTEVSISPDFKHAKIYVSTLGGAVNKNELLAGFNQASGFLRKELAAHLKWKQVPQLSFHYDDSIERGVRLLTIINDLNTGENNKL